MKHTLIITLTVISAFLALPPPTQAAAPLTVAVFDFNNTSRTIDMPGSDISLLLADHLAASPNLFLVERQQLDALLAEQDLSLSGMVSPNTAVQIGQITGANVLVMGRLMDVGKKQVILCRLMSTETTRIFPIRTEVESPELLDEALAELANSIGQTIVSRRDALVVPAPSPEQAMERWKAIVNGKTLPSVSVHVDEEHISQAVIDPAVQTEIRMTLLQLGFEVIDTKKSSQTPDFSITGEAFSEFSGQRGNFISCRARTEIEIFRVSDGALILSDRQTALVVSGAEHIAGKQALQETAVSLLDRIVPALVKK